MAEKQTVLMIITKVPLRVSLAGGGTDFEDFYSKYGGLCVSFAIDKYVYVIVKERYDDLIVLNYTQHEIVNKVDEIKHDLIRECLKWFPTKGGIEITTLADIPSAGSGLGSSSAITVGLLTALATYNGHSIPSKEVAEIACDIEIDILHSPIGKQDQYACAFGGFNTLHFLNDCVLVYNFDKKHYPIADNLFLHYTNTTRKSSGILTEQKANTKANTNNLLDIIGYASRLSNCIEEEKYDYVGIVLKETWKLKKQLSSNVSNTAIDAMVDMATTGGATGCKICGAGGGGFLLSYVPAENHPKFKTAMQDYRELPFKIDQYGSRIIFNIG